MEPLITNRLDPALLRVVDKRSNDRDDTPRRRRPAPSEKPAEPVDENAEPDPHALDDMA